MMILIMGLFINVFNIFKKKLYEYDNVIMIYLMKIIVYFFCGMMNRFEFIKYVLFMLLF